MSGNLDKDKPMPSNHPVALVTGSARRVGAAIVRRLHAAGYDVVIHHRNSEGEARILQAGLSWDRKKYYTVSAAMCLGTALVLFAMSGSPVLGGAGLLIRVEFAPLP